MRQKKTRRTPSRPSRSSGSLIKLLSILFLMISICVGAYWNLHTGIVSEQLADSKIVNIEKGRDNGKDAIYTDVSQEMHEAIDSWLKTQGADVTTIDTQERTEKRHATGGIIRWTTLSKTVIPTKPFTREALETQLNKGGGKTVLYRVEKTKHDGKDVTEYDIAYFDMLDTEQLYLVTDKLYVTEPKANSNVIEKVKNMILRSSSGSLKDTSTKSPSSDTAQTLPSQITGQLAIVIDDCGSSTEILQKFNTIPIPLTYAVMPNKKYTAECAESGYEANRKIFVHMPMQPLNIQSSETVYIGTDMSDSKVKATADEMLDQVPHATGMNNHQGSMATADTRLMEDVMSVLKKRRLMYLDSRTNSASIGEQLASSMGIATSRNNLFIDNDADVSSVKNRLRQAGQIAKNNGSAIVIGHCRLNTAQAICEMVGELNKEGIDIVFATDLMQ